MGTLTVVLQQGRLICIQAHAWNSHPGSTSTTALTVRRSSGLHRSDSAAQAAAKIDETPERRCVSWPVTLRKRAGCISRMRKQCEGTRSK